MRHICILITTVVAALAAEIPPPPGRLVDIGGYRLHLNCSGKGSPTVVVETGLDEFSFDWNQVQARVADTTRVCTYDRAGYAWSEPGPKPRTYAQLNLELHELLRRAKEKGPYVLVGHSFGGPVVREFARRYPKLVAGMVLVDTVHEDQRIIIGGKPVQLRATAKGIPIPAPRLEPGEAIANAGWRNGRTWASSLPALQVAEDDQRLWSPEGLLFMHDHPKEYELGDMPLLVLMRANGGYSDRPGISGEELDRQRREQQAALAHLSTRGKLKELNCGHDMQTEAPDLVAMAIRQVVQFARR